MLQTEPLAVKYAIIADIHANLGALQAVLRDAEQQGCTHTACLGDIVVDYDKPKECVDIIRGMAIPNAPVSSPPHGPKPRLGASADFET